MCLGSVTHKAKSCGFLDRVATHILAFEGDSQVRWFEGNFTDYADYRKREHGVDAMRPHRLKYKPVSRS